MSYVDNVFGRTSRSRDFDDEFDPAEYVEHLYDEAQDWYDAATGYSKGDSRRDECMEEYSKALAKATKVRREYEANGWI